MGYWVLLIPRGIPSFDINTDNIPHKDISQLFYVGEGVEICQGPSGNVCDSSTNEVLGFGFPVRTDNISPLGLIPCSLVNISIHPCIVVGLLPSSYRSVAE